MRFGKEHRISCEHEISDLFSFGKYLKSEPYSFRYLTRSASDTDCAKLLVSVSKKAGKAHDRNRIKRLFREAFRTSEAIKMNGLKVAVVAKRKSSRLDLKSALSAFKDLESQISQTI